jgi:hypothetical protein
VQHEILPERRQIGEHIQVSGQMCRRSGAFVSSYASFPTASAVGYDLGPSGAPPKKPARYVHLPIIILSSLPFFADPRNLEMGILTAVRRREGLHVGI